MITWEEKFETETLQADIAKGGYGISTHPRQATELLKLDTVQRRIRAYNEASTLQNLSGGTLGGNLYSAVVALKRMISAGRENEEMYAERANRVNIEKERAIKERTGRTVIVFPPEMKR